MNKTCRSVGKAALGAGVAPSKLDGMRRKAVRRAAVALAVSLMAVGAAQAQTRIGDNTSGTAPDAARLVENIDRVTDALDADPPEAMAVFSTDAITGDDLQAGRAVWESGHWVDVDETTSLHVNSSADLAPAFQGTGYSPCGACSI